jgi:integrase
VARKRNRVPFSSRDKRFLVRLSDGFPKVRFHDLRHTPATQLLLAGVHRKIAQGRLGHSTIATTMDIYGHVCDTLQKDAAAKIDVALRGQAAFAGKFAGNENEESYNSLRMPG